MIPTRIFLDLDDVCNAFTLYALKAVGCPVEAFDFEKYKPAWGFNIVMAANALHPNSKYTHNYFTRESFWDRITRRVWANAPESTEFKKLLRMCVDLVGKENVCLLTTPINDPECLAGKLVWIHDHCPKWLHRQYLMGPQKYLLTQPDALLIDDSDKNIEEFLSPPNGQPGGQVLLVPRPWNSLHGVDTTQELNACFEMLCP